MSAPPFVAPTLIRNQTNICWGAHVARLNHKNSLHHLARYRSFEWWRFRQEWSQLRHPEARHPKPFNALRHWEHAFKAFQQWCKQQLDKLNPFKLLGISPDAPWRALAMHNDLWEVYAFGLCRAYKTRACSQ
eukprot:10437991-Heterocapsa_arctica.AAC.1